MRWSNGKNNIYVMLNNEIVDNATKHGGINTYARLQTYIPLTQYPIYRNELVFSYFAWSYKLVDILQSSLDF